MYEEWLLIVASRNVYVLVIEMYGSLHHSGEAFGVIQKFNQKVKEQGNTDRLDYYLGRVSGTGFTWEALRELVERVEQIE